MTFSLPDHWVWDCWLARDGARYHLYYLFAPTSIGDPDLRHRHAAIGHATSTDLRSWVDHGRVLGPGGLGSFDRTATWTGCVVPGPDGLWRMFYTGARFLDDHSMANIETIGVATSADLHTWVKQPEPVLNADERWYERLADATWREEAWRDPWVFPDPAGDGWHMLLTGRAKGAADDPDRGVLAHAVSSDLAVWTAAPPLSAPGAGFLHLEVPQTVTVEGRDAVVFSCDTAHLAGGRRARGEHGGVWAVAGDVLAGSVAARAAHRIVDDRLYAARVTTAPNGTAVLIGFVNHDGDGAFRGGISDPLPLTWIGDDRLGIRPDPGEGSR